MLRFCRTHLDTLPRMASLATDKNKDIKSEASSASLLILPVAELKPLKRCLLQCSRFASDLHAFLSSSSTSSTSPVASPLAAALFPLLSDVTTEEAAEEIAASLQPVASNRELHDSIAYRRALALVAPIMQNAGTHQVRAFNHMPGSTTV